MDDTKVSVTLTGPAKIDGRREPQGKTLSVSEAVRRQLVDAGVVVAHQNPADQLFEHVDSVTQSLDRVATAEAERDAALEKVNTLQAAAVTDAARIAELEQQIEKLTAKKKVPDPTADKTPPDTEA